jgi:[ribosomal protein S5]-alanine N-acetyltransferase
MGTVPTIVSNRLRLVSLTVECLRALSERDARRARLSCGFAIPERCSLLGKPHLGRRLAMIAKDPEQHPWMDRAVVTRKDNVMVGYISFHHKAPDPDLFEYSDCAAELGYTIEPDYRRNGYAKESALAMMEWAALCSHVTTFCLSIGPENTPSIRMAESMGFEKTSERMDDTDGLEYVYVARGDLIRRRNPIEISLERE